MDILEKPNIDKRVFYLPMALAIAIPTISPWGPGGRCHPRSSKDIDSS